MKDLVVSWKTSPTWHFFFFFFWKVILKNPAVLLSFKLTFLKIKFLGS